MSKIISWDIGINNLAYCIMDIESKKILKWNIIDILESIRQIEYICEGILKSGSKCSNIASLYKIDNSNKKYYCGMHCKKDGIKICATTLCSSFNKNGKSCKSNAYYFVDTDPNSTTYYCEKHKKQSEGLSGLKELSALSGLREPSALNDNTIQFKKYITVDNISFFDRSRLLYEKLEEVNSRDNILDVDVIVIENQPVFKNPIMKSIQMLLYSYYLSENIIKTRRSSEIHLLNATQKMKVYTGPKIECAIKDVHERNKYLAKEYCKYMLKDDNEMLEYFNSFNKKDDLADTFLQAHAHINSAF